MVKAMDQVGAECSKRAYTMWLEVLGKSLILGSFSAAAVLCTLGYSGTPVGDVTGFFAYTVLWTGIALGQHASGYKKGYDHCLQRSTALRQAAELASNIVNLIGSKSGEDDEG